MKTEFIPLTNKDTMLDSDKSDLKASPTNMRKRGIISLKNIPFEGEIPVGGFWRDDEFDYGDKLE